MKKYLRVFIITTLALWLVSRVGEGIYYPGFLTLGLAGVTLGVLNLLAKPLVNLLLLPLNMATMGMFRWVASVVALYLALKLVPAFQVTGFAFSGFTYQGVVLPPLALGFWGGLVVVALLVSLVASVLLWLAH